MKLKDVSLNYFCFYLHDKPDDNEKPGIKDSDFLVILNEAVKEIGGWLRTRQQIKPKVLRQKGGILLLANTIGGWVKCCDLFHRKVISRSRLDVFILQTGILKECVFDDSKLEEAIQNLPKFVLPEEKHSFKSVCRCIFIELEDYKNSGSLDKVFKDAFKGLVGGEPLFRQIDLGFARVAILENDPGNSHRAIWAIIPIGDQEIVNKATTFVDDILYQYFLAFAKVRNESETVQTALDEAVLFRSELAGYLRDSLTKTPASLLAMEKAQEKLSDLRINLATEMTTARKHINTININIGNAEKLLESAYLNKNKEELDKLLLNPLRLVREQIEADLSYCEIDLNKGNLTNEKLEDITQIRLAQWSRKATLFFGLLSAVGILQLFPKEFADNDNLAFVFSWEAFFYKPFWVKFAVISYISGTS